MHFQRIIFPWTDRSLGNCSYLDTCRHTRTCKYVHYQLDEEPDVPEDQAPAKLRPNVPAYLAVRPQPPTEVDEIVECSPLCPRVTWDAAC